MSFIKIENEWKGMDPDDVSGYLHDYLYTELKDDNGVISEDEVQDIITDDPQRVFEIMMNVVYALKVKRQDD